MQLDRYLRPGGSVSFWHTPVAPVFYAYRTLEDYYIDLAEKTRYAGPFDERGIPLLDYRGAIGRRYNPCAVAQYALGWYQRWRRGEAHAQKRFLDSADWLRESLVPDDAGCGRWYYDFDLDAYGIRAPWISGLAQGQGISVLLRAQAATGDTGFATAAAQACAALLRPVEAGGTLRREGADVYLEEIVTERRTAILDGMIFAVFGLQDYCFATGQAAAQKTLTACIDTLERILPQYDLGYWSRADLYQENPPMIASRFYHGLHVAQLAVLADLTGRETFRQCAVRWERYASQPVNAARALVAKAWFKLRHY